MSQPVSATAKRLLAELEALHAAMKDEPNTVIREAAYRAFGQRLFANYAKRPAEPRHTREPGEDDA